MHADREVVLRMIIRCCFCIIPVNTHRQRPFASNTTVLSHHVPQNTAQDSHYYYYYYSNYYCCLELGGLNIYCRAAAENSPAPIVVNATPAPPQAVPSPPQKTCTTWAKNDER